jgi:RNA-binding protein
VETTGGSDDGDERGPGADASGGPPLRGFQKRALRARAHALPAVAQVGDAGLSPGVLAAVDAALRDHELVKVRMREPEDKKGQARALARATGAALCGLVGHTVILYRPHPESPRIRLPERPGRPERPGPAGAG